MSAIDASYAPLQGKCILVTRARSQASELRRTIEQYGGEAIEFPVIQVVPVRDRSPVDDVISRLDKFEWIVFTSINGVEFFFDRVEELGFVSALPAKIAAVGPKTADAIRERGRQVSVVATDFKAEGLVEALKDLLQPGDRILFPKASIARATLPNALALLGMTVTEVSVYETLMTTDGAAEISERLKRKSVHAVTFTSSSTVKNFCEALSVHTNKELLDGVKVVCIGPVTANQARSLGLEVDAVAEQYTIEGLLGALIRLMKEGDSR
jgi:uroporphyrinogen III methyltransferase/synthase